MAISATRGAHRDRIQAVILDWAGTTVDHGSLAPVRTLERVMAQRGVPVSEEEARLHMGLLKRDHIFATLQIPRVASSWTAKFGRPSSTADVDSLYAEFIPLQMACLGEYSTLIPGVREALNVMRGRGWKIGATTGYTRPMLDLLLEKAAPQGYTPDCASCPDDVGAGRPHPFMCYLIASRLKVYPLETYLKVGDTAVDIEEGLNAGMWSIGVARTGNAVGLTYNQFNALSRDDQQSRLTRARAELAGAGAHYVIDSLLDLPAVADDIENRLRRGERP